MPGKLGRQIARNFNRFGAQLKRGGDVFGRQVANTSRDISSGLGEAKRIVSGIEKSVSGVPLLGGLAKIASGTINQGLDIAGGLNKSIGSAGSGVRALTSGDFDKAQESFTDASNQAIGSIQFD